MVAELRLKIFKVLILIPVYYVILVMSTTLIVTGTYVLIILYLCTVCCLDLYTVSFSDTYVPCDIGTYIVTVTTSS